MYIRKNTVLTYKTKNSVLITFVILIFIIGQIMPTTILYPICLNFISEAKGRVSAIIQGARLILTSIGLQIAGYFYVGSFQHIGIIIVAFIVVAIISLHFVLKNSELLTSIEP